MAGPFRVLVSNDDGIGAPGLRALVRALASDGGFEVVVCAPAEEQSAKSHAISVRERLHARRAAVPGAVEAWAVAGTPADSVMLGLSGRLLADAREFDAVASGINRGDNCGLHVHYSGTVGAAREAACKGVPAVALSHADHRARDEESYRECARESVAIIRAMARTGRERKREARAEAEEAEENEDGEKGGEREGEGSGERGGEGRGKGNEEGNEEGAPAPADGAAPAGTEDDASALRAAEDAHPFAHSALRGGGGSSACVRAPSLDYAALETPSASPLAGSVINVNFPERCTAAPARGLAVARVGRACVLPNFRERQTQTQKEGRGEDKDEGGANDDAAVATGAGAAPAPGAAAAPAPGAGAAPAPGAAAAPAPGAGAAPAPGAGGAPVEVPSAAPPASAPGESRCFLNLHGGHAHEGRPDSDTVLVRGGWTAVSPLALDNDLPLSRRSAELRHDLELVKALAICLRDAAKELRVEFAPGEAKEALQEGEMEEKLNAW